MNNYTIAPEEDFVHEPERNDPHWSESFGHWCYSPENNIAIFFHFQRSDENPDMWRELVIVHQPDGNVLVGKSYGINTDDRNPTANGLAIRCLEPYKSWQISFNGALRQIKSADLRSNVFEDGVWQAARITLDCQAHAALWYQQSGEESMEGMGKAHMEQPIRFSGELSFAGTTQSLAGLGLRDHSYGARNISVTGDAQWFHGQFPSGRCFLIFRFSTGGKTYDNAHVTDSTGVYDAEIVELSAIGHVDTGSTMDVVLKSELGVDKIHGEFIYAVPVTLDGAREQIPGRKPAEGAFFFYVGYFRYTWDDEVGYGATNVVLSKDTQLQLAGES